jgi:putative endonuclease
MNRYYVYLLLSLKDKRTYLGSTVDLQRRLWEHNQGKSKSTKNRRPLKLIYFETHNTLEDARNREKFLKTKKGRRELAKIFEKL